MINNYFYLSFAHWAKYGSQVDFWVKKVAKSWFLDQFSIVLQMITEGEKKISNLKQHTTRI